ncbi:hypothetical protein [Marinobacterium litorale]|uniref:hypothetical protein n=1 Tax=Marinobacterium litorale TaxID=404770 RepID=UPI000422452A|nr:hypothetical protein [Marinobacterium litorale]
MTVINDDEIADIYAAALDSVELLKKGQPVGDTSNWQPVIDRNKKHLESLLDRTFWTSEDLQPLRDSIAAEVPVYVRPETPRTDQYATEAYPAKAEGVWVQQWAYRPYTTPELSDIRWEKREAIKADHQAQCHQYVEFNGVLWRGGEASAVSIKNAADLADYSGAGEIILRDALKNPHPVSISQAKAIAATIGADYQIKFQAKEEALRKLDAINLSDPDAKAQIDAISL